MDRASPGIEKLGDRPDFEEWAAEVVSRLETRRREAADRSTHPRVPRRPSLAYSRWPLRGLSQQRG
ncbi:MAG: hypothetical protein M3304_00680 [Actinomycetota bacterium]|nr:hypothetical protein [Actinomycetota bacterium]